MKEPLQNHPVLSSCLLERWFPVYLLRYILMTSLIGLRHMGQDGFDISISFPPQTEHTHMCPHAYSTESTALSQQIKHSSPVIARHDGVLRDSEDSELNVVPGDHSNHKENSIEKYIFWLRNVVYQQKEFGKSTK